jgi:DNA-binding MarR family transcriptional regulator|tara:strand:+ start:754 stop:1194 length:441 start_codon:yes stop_codon:yes gene_type:complete
MPFDQLKLENQICFPVYAASRLITREYQPYLDQLGVTYPQYLVLMVLWESDEISVNYIAKKLILNTNTVTPLLKRMEKQGLLKRERSKTDERKVIICLTKKGFLLEQEAIVIPETLSKFLLKGNVEVEDLIKLKEQLNMVINLLSK